MKKVTLLSVFFLMLFGLIGCTQMKKEEIDVKQLVTAKEIINSIQKEMESNNLKVVDDVLMDIKENKPVYKIMNMYSEEETKYFPSIKHFDLNEISGGYILEANDPTKSSELIIVIEAKNSKTNPNVAGSLQKVLSDQYKEWEEHIASEYQLVKTNKIVYQGNFLLYVTSDNHKEIIKAFQKEAR